MKRFSAALFLITLSVLWSKSNNQISKAPADIAAAMLVKVAAFERNISSGGDICIYVMGADDVAAELKKGVGNSIGRSRLYSVESGSGLPAEKPSILYVGSPAKAHDAIQYTRSHKILSVTGNPDLIEEGLSLGFGIGEDEKPKILLNLNASFEESLDWNPALLKIAITVKQ